MSRPVSRKTKPAKNDLLSLMVKDHQSRIERLEDNGTTTIFKRMTASASASALLLGLVLTFASLYDVFITKPKADRINRLSQFNQAVNSAAKIRQDLTLLNTQDPKVQLAVLQAATPQILNNVSTARAMLRTLSDDEIDVPQLIVLIYESFTAGDLESAKEFVGRAVKKPTTAYSHSEAKRYEGKYLFLTGHPAEGRQSFNDALNILDEANTPARAFVLSDLATTEFVFGDCEEASTQVKNFLSMLPKLPLQFRRQLTAALADQLRQMQGQRCNLPETIFAGLENGLSDGVASQ
jgi:hypothetical protein